MTVEQFDVIIVGGGPAGVAAATELRRRGVDRVVIFDREPHLGGATRHCGHSPFGMREFGRIYLGAAYGKRLEQEAAQHGVQVRYGHSVTRLRETGAVEMTSADGVSQAAARRVLVTTGARETPRSARLLPGDRPIGIVTTGALQSYVAFHGLIPFRRPLILGSELVSLSALLTCFNHGIRPVAMIDTNAIPLVRPPSSWFPKMIGIPLHLGAEIVDIIGEDRVSAVLVRIKGRLVRFDCDGLLLTGQFTPESELYRRSNLGVEEGSGGPLVDQNGCTENRLIYSAGNVLRGVETAGWSYREGRAVGAAIARDLDSPQDDSPAIKVAYSDPLKLVVPGMLRPNAGKRAAFEQFQIRFLRPVRGRLSLFVDGKKVWSCRRRWLPERRFLVPVIRPAALSGPICFQFESDG